MHELPTCGKPLQHGVGRVAEWGRFQRSLAEQKVHRLPVVGQGDTLERVEDRLGEVVDVASRRGEEDRDLDVGEIRERWLQAVGRSGQGTNLGDVVAHQTAAARLLRDGWAVDQELDERRGHARCVIPTRWSPAACW